MRSSTNRREFVAGAAAAAGVLALPERAPAATRAVIPTDLRADVIHRGRAIAVTRRASHLVVAHAARRALVITDRRTHKARTVELPGQPLELAIAPSDRVIAVTTAFWDKPGLSLVTLKTASKPTRLDAGAAPFAPAFTHDGKHLLITGGEQAGTLRIHGGTGFASARTVELGRVPRGIVVTPDDRAAWVALQGEDVVVRVDLRSAKVTKRVATAPLPDRLAISKDGRHLLVSHAGHDVDALTEVETKTGKRRTLHAGARVADVAYGASGRRLAALPDASAILAIDARGKRRRTATVRSPRGLVVAGSHAFTVSAVDGQAGRVRS